MRLFLLAFLVFISCSQSKVDEKKVNFGKEESIALNQELIEVEELNIDIYPADRFDAMWDKNSLLSGDAMKFFRSSSNAQQMVDELFEKKYIVNHWHNNWRTIPEAGSPYKILLRQLAG